MNEGKVDMALIDDAVRRILTKKFELGLFDNPYCYNNRAKEIEDKEIVTANRQVAREAGSSSIVLLKNKSVLPVAESESHWLVL